MRLKRWLMISIPVALLLGFLILLVIQQPAHEPAEPTPAVSAETDAAEASSPTENNSTTTTRIPIVTYTPTEAPTFHPMTPEPSATPDPWVITVIPPDCLSPGTILKENTEEGYIITEEGEPPPGHEWSEWTRSGNLYQRMCSRCGAEETRDQLYEASVPRIDLIGSLEGISKSDRVITGFRFTSTDEFFEGYSFNTWQGHTTLAFPKKNYTLRIYEDDDLDRKHLFRFRSWNAEHKYVLKANYRDISMMRNLIAADLWADMAASRPGLHEDLRKSSHFGAVDGFPVLLYLNDTFSGLYTMNLHIDNDLYRMNHADDAVMIANSSEPDETRFLARAAFTDEKSAWEVEYCGSGEDDEWAKDKLNELIAFVMESDDETFRMQLGEHLDVDAAIDYLIFLYVTGLRNNASKDLVLLKYHDCDQWIPTVYDLEAAFGLDLETQTWRSAEDFLPSRTGSGWDSSTGNLLWDRLLNAFTPGIRSRYAALRKTVLTPEALTKRVRTALATIPDEYRNMDLALYPRRLPDTTPEEQMTAYIPERLLLLDRLLGDEAN